MIELENALQVRVAEREAVLARIVTQLAGDERVVAAWLHGSLGRGGGDALSDLDVHVVAADHYSETMNAERQAYAARIGPLLLMQEAPYNAPAGGAFLLVMYPGSVGPVQVDWTWQPQAGAVIPSDVRVLVDRVGLPSAALAGPLDAEGVADSLTERSVFFWMMVQVAAKTIARGQGWSAVVILNYAREALATVRELLGRGAEGRIDPVPARPAEQMAAVRGLADEMAALTAEIAGRGGQAPAGVILLAYRFFELTEAMITRPG